MSQYSNEECFEMLMLYAICNRNSRQTAEEYKRRFPNSRPPSRKFIYQLVQRIRTTGCVRRQGSPSRHIASSKDTEIDILSYFVSYPHASTRSVATELNVPHSTVWRILRQHNWHPYSIRAVHAQVQSDYQRRLDFCNWGLNQEDSNPSFLRNVLWTDECCFKQDGTINRQNDHFWSETNPCSVREVRNQRQYSINVWAGIFQNSLVGPIFYSNTLTGDRFLHLILNGVVSDFMDELPLSVLQCMWFQLDGAPPHHTSAVRHWLNREFPNKWLGLQGPVEFPPRSPDLSPLDFYLCGRLRRTVYLTPPVDLQDLCQRIKDACSGITSNELERVHRNIVRRMQLCIGVDGEHFEQLL